jgi:hypothetical protein
MKFDYSKSVLLEKGRAVNYRYPIETPAAFSNYKFRPDVLREAVEEFNRKLDHRPHVTMHFENSIRVDVLRLVPVTEDTLAIWLVVKEKDVDIVNEKCFTIRGDVYFVGESDVDVDRVIIHDVVFDDDHGIFAS